MDMLRRIKKQVRALRTDSIVVEGMKFRGAKPTQSKTHSIYFGKTRVLKIEHRRNRLKLNTLEQEAEVIAYLNSQGCVTCPALLSVGKLPTGEPYFIQERIFAKGKPNVPDMLFALLEQKSFGIYQGDFKPANAIFDGSVCYLVDYDQAQSEDKFVGMGNVEYIEWIAQDFKKRRGHDFFTHSERNFDKGAMLELFREDSFNLGKTTVFDKQDTTRAQGGIYHTLNHPKIYILGARGLESRLAALDAIQFRQGETVLDVGCNMGLLSHYLYDRGCTVTGIDMDPNIIIAAKMVANILGKNIDFRCADMDVTDIVGCFDTICLFSVLHHVQNLERTFEFISKRSSRIVLESRLRERGSKPMGRKWKHTSRWKFANVGELVTYIEARCAVFQFEKNYGQVDRERYVLTFTKPNSASC